MWIDAVHHQVDGEVDDVDVAGALAVAEERSLYPVGASEHGELGGSSGGAAIVVGVEADDDAVAAADVAAEPLDDIGVHVRRVALDRGRKVQDERSLRGGLHHVHYGVAHLERELWLGEREALGRVLVPHLRAGHGLLELAAQPGSVDGDVDDARPVEAEDHLALERIGRVVEVNDCPRHAGDGFVGPLDEFLAALHEHLHRDIVGDQILVDELPAEVEVGLACRWETDLDLLKAHLDERVKHAPLALRVHRVDERLVAVAEVDAAPDRRCFVGPVRPGAVGEHERDIPLVLLEGHRGGAGGRGCHGVRFRSCAGGWRVDGRWS